MEKIKKLMEELGLDSVLGEELIKLMQEHIETEKKKLQESTKAKLEEAKKVCSEEVKKEVARLSRGVEVYLESKSKHIERAKTQQLANEESKSASLLENVKALVEGVDISKGSDKNGELQAASRKISLLEHKVKRLSLEKSDFKEKLAKTTEIAAQATRRNQLLESKVRGTESKGKETKVVSEDVKKANAKGKEVAKKTLTEARTQVDKQDRKPAASKPSQLTPESIAEAIK